MKYAIVIVLLAFLSSCAATVDEGRRDAILQLSGSASQGESSWLNNCERCHGPDGNGDGQGPSLEGLSISDSDVVTAILAGPLTMPTFSDLDDQEIADLAAYVDTL